METKRGPSKSRFVSSVVKAMREAGLKPRVDWKPDGSVSIVPVAEEPPETGNELDDWMRKRGENARSA